MKFSPLAFFALACLLVACGPLSIQVEPLNAVATPTALPLQITLTPIPQPLAPTITPTPPVVPVASATPLPTAGPDLRLKPGTALKMVQTHMLTAQSGWGVAEGSGDASQRLVFTVDGGVSWRDRSPSAALLNPPTSGLAATAYFASAESAWVFYAPRAPQEKPASLAAWRTHDGGKTWQVGAPLDLSGLQQDAYRVPSNLGFLDSQRGWVLVHLGVGMSHDYVALFTTADGGATWQRSLDPETQPVMMACPKSGALFTSTNTAWISGDCPGLMPRLFLFRTADGGATWNEATLPVPTGKGANYFAQDGIACGILALMPAPSQAVALTLRCINFNNNTAQSWLYTSSDHGENWSQRVLPGLAPSLDLINPSEAVLVASLKVDPAAGGAVYRTINAGADWVQLTPTTWLGTPDFVDLQNGWVVATHNQVSAFVHTIDGGRTWIELKPVVTA